MTDFVLERHSDFTNPPLTDLSAYVVSVTWTDRTQAPWDSLTFTIEWSPTVKPCEIGDWCVLRLRPGGPAVAWGQVAACGAQNGMTGVSRKTGTWTVQCVGWMQAMMRAQLVSALSFTDATAAGTMVTMEGFTRLVEAISKSVSLVGLGLSHYIRTACRTWLPASMASQNLGDAVRVVYDYQTVAKFAGTPQDERAGAYTRVIEAIPAYSMPALMGGAEIASVMGVAINSFKGDDLLTECFPSLEDIGDTPVGTDALEPLATVAEAPKADPISDRAEKFIGAGNRDALEALLKRQIGVERSGNNLIPGESLANRPMGTQLTPDQIVQLQGPPSQYRTVPGAPSILGRNPVMIYRMRPWRDQALSDWAGSVFGPFYPAVQVIDKQSFTAFDGVTWNVARAVKLTSDDVIGWPGGTPSADTATLFTTSWPGTQSPVLVMREFGLPVVDAALCYRRGAKTYNAYWPFFGNYQGADETTKAGVLATAAAVALQATQFGAQNDRFWEGTISCQTFRPDVRHGEPFQLTMDGGAATLIGYVESVTHTLTRGASRASTTSFQYSRGLWDESQRNLATFRRAATVGGVRRGVVATVARDAPTAAKVKATRGTP